MGEEETDVRELRLWTAAVAAPAAAAGFYALAVLRRRRSLHPTGVGYQGELLVGNDGRVGVPLFRPGAAHTALLRFSRGAGLPEPLPDALGVAVKLPDAHGPGRPGSTADQLDQPAAATPAAIPGQKLPPSGVLHRFALRPGRGAGGAAAGPDAHPE